MHARLNECGVIPESGGQAGRFVIVNIADVKIDNKLIPLERWTVECGKVAGLTYEGQEHPYELNYRFGLQGDGVASEPVFVFRKPLMRTVIPN